VNILYERITHDDVVPPNRCRVPVPPLWCGRPRLLNMVMQLRSEVQRGLSLFLILC